MRWITKNALCTVILANTLSLVISQKQLPSDMTFSLSGHSLDWPCQNTKNIYMTNGRYIARNVIATRTQIYKDDAIVAMPRYKPGVPFTLGVMSLKIKDCEPKVAPFPCWQIQEEGNCQALQNVVDVVLDFQDILWVLDVGIVNTLEQPVRRCPPKLVGINAKSGKVVKVIDLSSLVTPLSRLHYFSIEYTEDGEVYAYITDATENAIIIYNITSNKGYRVILPNAVTTGTKSKDVLYTALVKKSCGTSYLYFTYLGSDKLFAIKTVNLREGNTQGSVVDVGPKQQKIVLLGTDDASALFFRLKGQSDVYVWNTETPFRAENFILVQKGEDYQLPTQVVSGNKKLMWVIESNFQDYIQDTVSCSGASVDIHPLDTSYEN